MEPSPRRRKIGTINRTFRSFRYFNFRWIWIGAFTSTTGYFVAQVAESWYIYQQTSSATLLGLTAFLNGLPILMFSVFGGVLADRMDRRYLLIGSQILQMVAAFVLAILFFLERIEVWHILFTAFLAGVGQAFGGPAYQAMIPSLVPKKHLPNAIALISIQFNLAGTLGRPIGGWAFKYFGPARCFLINGLSFFAVIVTLLVIRIPFIPSPGQLNMVKSLREGFRYVARSGALRSLMLLAVLTAFCGVPINTLLPVFAQQTYGLDAGGYSRMGAVLSLGAVLGALAVAHYGTASKKGRNALILELFLGAAILGFAFNKFLAVAMLLLLVTGGTILAVFTLVTSLVQLNVTEDIRGRVMSVHNAAFRGAMPLINILCGFAADKVGASRVIATNGIALILMACVFLFGNSEVTDL